MPAEPRITLLGPQREPTLHKTVRSLGLHGRRFATITAGWRDREDQDELLVSELGGNALNLRLWRLMQQLWEADPELAELDRQRRQTLTEMQDLYVIGLQQVAEALRRIRAREPRDPRIHQMALEDAVRVMRELDERHCERVTELHADFYERYEPQHRKAVIDARYLVGQRIADCDAVAITGGHIGVLLGALHIFNIAPNLAFAVDPTDDDPDPAPGLHRPIVAWGAGAMALTERVLLFYDDSVVSPGVSEMLMDGIGLTRGVVALPNGSDRLDIKNRPRMANLVQRCAPRLPLILDVGAQVTLPAAGGLPTGARVVGPEGKVVRYDREAAA